MRDSRFSLRTRIFIPLAALVTITLLGGVITLWYASATRELFVQMEGEDINALLAAQKLESSLVMQKGYVTYYFLDGDEGWLDLLTEYHRQFNKWLGQARKHEASPRGREILAETEAAYAGYTAIRQEVVQLYQEGKRAEGAALHQEARRRFSAVYDLCERFRELNEITLAKAGADYKKQVHFLTAFSWIGMGVTVLLGLFLAYVIHRQVLRPLRNLAAGGPMENGTPLGDEVKALSVRLKGLVSDVDSTRAMLRQSREHLKQSEKMAMVGKLAAGVAHSIRNPLTSVKMRLFSLERTLTLDPVQKEDFEVVSEEIRHVDTIIRNFLEFARPPKLTIHKVSLSDVVDTSVNLVRHRLESAGVDLSVARDQRLPEIEADGDQIKEVLVNLILNSCDAMPSGGTIAIHEAVRTSPSGGYVVITLRDSGPGVPADLLQEIFSPFFTTKEDGTGLGLSIARRIVEEHGGSLGYEPKGQGACFVMAVPVKEA